MPPVVAEEMARQRALMTETERSILSGVQEVKDNYRYSVESRVRSRIRGPLAEDVEALRDNQPEIFSILVEVVCGDDIAASDVQERETASREPDEAAEHPGETTTEPQDRASIEAAEPPDAPDDVAGGALMGVEFPSSRDRDDCVRIVAAAYRYLQERGKATMRQFVQDVMPDHSLGYDVPDLEEGDRFRGAWWRSIVRPGLAALPDVQEPEGGDRWWRIREAADE